MTGLADIITGYILSLPLAAKRCDHTTVLAGGKEPFVCLPQCRDRTYHVSHRDDSDTTDSVSSSSKLNFLLVQFACSGTLQLYIKCSTARGGGMFFFVATFHSIYV